MFINHFNMTGSSGTPTTGHHSVTQTEGTESFRLKNSIYAFLPTLRPSQTGEVVSAVKYCTQTDGVGAWQASVQQKQTNFISKSCNTT